MLEATAAKPAPRAVHWLLLLAAFGALAWLIMRWRWGGTVADSLAYFNTARYLRGELPFSALEAPFPYRIAMPALAAWLPGELHHSFASLNWLAMSSAACMVSMSLLRLGLSKTRAVVGGLLLLLCVPTYWYAPYLLVDPGSICARAAFVLAVACGQPWLAAAIGVLASAVREENIVLLFWLLAARQIGLLAGLASVASALGWMVAVRWLILPGLPSYVWRPQWSTVMTALADWRSLASLAGGAGLVLPLALYGLRAPPPSLRPLRSLLLLMALPPLYAALCVRVDGRAIWGLYPMLIPFAVALPWPLRR